MDRSFIELKLKNTMDMEKGYEQISNLAFLFNFLEWEEQKRVFDHVMDMEETYFYEKSLFIESVYGCLEKAEKNTAFNYIMHSECSDLKADVITSIFAFLTYGQKKILDITKSEMITLESVLSRLRCTYGQRKSSI